VFSCIKLTAILPNICYLLGSLISVCLPVNINRQLEGVTCADIILNSLFSEVAFFQQTPLSYAFLIDDDGHVLLHPLLPQPQTSNDKPLVLDILDLETGEAAAQVKSGILRFVKSRPLVS